MVQFLKQKELGWSNSVKTEFLSNIHEGYSFPDTYLLDLDFTGKDIAKRMENQFNEKTTNLSKEAAEKSSLNFV